MTDSATPQLSAAARRWTLGLLMLTYAFSFLDRTIVLTLGEALKRDMGLSDAQLGILGGTTFAIFYGFLTIPIARLAERRSRVAILSVCLVIWSLMTALCGAAQNFTQLVLARIGVGAGEAGGQPTSHSLIADLYPQGKRSTATAIFQLGVPLGIATGALVGGWLTQHFSWRVAFLVVGLPGIVLALLIRLTMREPARGGADANPAALPLAPESMQKVAAPRITAVLRKLGENSIFLHVILGAMLAATAGNGISQFLHAYFLRSYDLGYAQAALIYGMIQAVAIGCGTLIGGIASDRLSKRGTWLQPITPAVGLLIGGPLAVFGFGQPQWEVAAAFVLVSGILTSTYFAPMYGITHGLLEPRMRATGAAILTVGLGLISLGLGPVLAGVASDVFAQMRYDGGDFALCKVTYGEMAPPACKAATAQGLTDALRLGSAIYVWAAVHFALAGRALARAARQAPA